MMQTLAKGLPRALPDESMTILLAYQGKQTRRTARWPVTSCQNSSPRDAWTGLIGAPCITGRRLFPAAPGPHRLSAACNHAHATPSSQGASLTLMAHTPIPPTNVPAVPVTSWESIQVHHWPERILPTTPGPHQSSAVSDRARLYGPILEARCSPLRRSVPGSCPYP